MKTTRAFMPLLIGAIILMTACSRDNMKKDAGVIAEAMCRNIEVMNKIMATNPKDTVALRNLHARSEKLQSEMSDLYKEFNKKFGDKIKDPEFNRKFSMELRKAMLNCQYLSKEDRAQFESELKE